MAQQVVAFTVGGKAYALPIDHVREVVAWSAPTPLPGAPPLVEGVLRLREEVIPVVDLGQRFGTGRVRPDAEARIVVVEWDGQVAGLVVDEVTEVLQLRPEQVTPPAPIAVDPAERMVDGIARVGDRLVLLLDLRKVVHQASEAARASGEGGGAVA